MKREVLTEDLRRLYRSTDMVKADCGGCIGCSDCCSGMGESIVLDPLDVYRLASGLGSSFGQLMQEKLELNVVDGIILPNLKMAGEQERCSFLNEQGRCTVHSIRPGICRLFPLGRYYENGGFQYFLQSRECKKENKSKIKVSKWLDTPDLKRYEQYITDWHYFLEEVRELLEKQQDEQLNKDLNTYILDSFYAASYDGGKDFYGQFYELLERTKKLVKILEKRNE